MPLHIPIPAKAQRNRDGTVAMINIVFLLLIFFLIAGTIAPPFDDDISLVKSSRATPAPPPDALILKRDGTLVFQSKPTSVEEHVAAVMGKDGTSRTVLLAVDRDLPATQMLDVIAQLKRAGATPVQIVTERRAK